MYFKYDNIYRFGRICRMSYHDFLRNFEKLEICHLDPETADVVQSARPVKRSWKTEVFDGSWVKNATAGGCRNFLGRKYHILEEKPRDDMRMVKHDITC